MRVTIIAGEASGDLHAAQLAEALRALEPTIEITGVGGPRMRALNIPLLAASDNWGAMGIPEAVRKGPGLLVQMLRLAYRLRQSPPDVLVLIDFGAFNMALLGRVRDAVPRVLYYIPPGCWDRHRQGGRLPFLVDAVATPFPWSAENLRAVGGPAQVTWVGHPLLDYCRLTISREEARARLGITGGPPSPAAVDTGGHARRGVPDSMERKVLALLPGSRDAEVRHLLSYFYAAARALNPAPHCLLAAAPNLDRAALLAQAPAGLTVTPLNGLDYDLMQAADAALVASGTAALELAVLGVPMVVAYRASFTTWLQYKLLEERRRRIRHVALPNIILDEGAVPELLQYDCTVEKLTAAVAPLMSATAARQEQLAAFARVRAALGEPGAVKRTAEIVRNLSVTNTDNRLMAHLRK